MTTLQETNTAKPLSMTEKTKRMAALRRHLVAVVKAAPMKKRTALLNAILASQEIEDTMCRPWDDGRKLLGFIRAACGKGR